MVVKLSTSESWLACATAGQMKYNHPSLGRTSLLDSWLNHLENACNSEIEFKEVGVTGVVEDEFDPMAEMGAGAEPEKHARTSGGGKKDAAEETRDGRFGMPSICS